MPIGFENAWATTDVPAREREMVCMGDDNHHDVDARLSPGGFGVPLSAPPASASSVSGTLAEARDGAGEPPNESHELRRGESGVPRGGSLACRCSCFALPAPTHTRISERLLRANSKAAASS